MVSKESRTKVRVNKHRKFVIVSAALPRDRVWLCLEAIIICMLRLLTILLEILWFLLPPFRRMLKAELEKTNNVEAAAYLGTVIAKKALEKGINTVVFDRGGFIYQGKMQGIS